MPAKPDSLEKLAEFLNLSRERLIEEPVENLNKMREAMAREDFMLVHMLGYKIK